MDNPDLIYRIASKCEDPCTTFHLVTMNKHIYAHRTSKQLSRMRFQAARYKIAPHVAELPSRIVSGKSHLHPDRAWCYYTIITRSCCISLFVNYQEHTTWYLVIIPKPLKIHTNLPSSWIHSKEIEFMWFEETTPPHRYETRRYPALHGTCTMLSEENRARAHHFIDSSWRRTLSRVLRFIWRWK